MALSPASFNQRLADFHSTAWSIVVKASGDGLAARPALEELCRIYWYPLFAFHRRRGASAVEAEDAVQSFFSHMLENHIVRRADPNRGRFRGFLVASFRQFLTKKHEYDSAQKRKPATAILSIDTLAAEDRYRSEFSDGVSPDQLFDYAWAVSIVNRAMTLLEAEQIHQGNEKRFVALHGTLTGQSSKSFADLGVEIGISEGAARVAVHRLRQRYAAILREEVAATLEENESVDDELRNLMAALELGRNV